MTWTTAALAAIDDQKTLVIFTVVFGRDDNSEQTKTTFVADVEKGQVNADFLADQATAFINRLNGVDAAKQIALGPITLKIAPQPNAERDAYFTKMRIFGTLNAPFGMGLVTKAQKDRDILLAELEGGFDITFFQ